MSLMNNFALLMNKIYSAANQRSEDIFSTLGNKPKGQKAQPYLIAV